MQLRVFSLLCFLLSLLCCIPPVLGGPKCFLTIYFLFLALYFAFIGCSYMAKYGKCNRHTLLTFDKWSGWKKVLSVCLVLLGFCLSTFADLYFAIFCN